jgi:hypothetical protein
METKTHLPQLMELWVFQSKSHDPASVIACPNKKKSSYCADVSRPEGAVGIIWVYIGIIVRNDGALRAGKKLYIYLCGLCVARDKMTLSK